VFVLLESWSTAAKLPIPKGLNPGHVNGMAWLFEPTRGQVNSSSINAPAAHTGLPLLTDRLH